MKSVTPAADPVRLPVPPHRSARRRRAASARAAASALGGPDGQCRAAFQQRRGRRELAAAIQRDVAAGRQRLPRQVGGRAGQRLHGEVVGHQNSFKADTAADDRPDHGRGQCRRQGGVQRGIDDVRRHHPGQVGVQGERQHIGVEVVGLDARQREMAVHPGAAMAGRVLADRLDAGGQQPRGHGAAQARDGERVLRQRAVADDRVRRRGSPGPAPARRPRRSRRRRSRRPISAPVSQAARSPARGSRANSAPNAAGRMGAPVRRSQAGDPAALLIHHEHGAWAAARGASVGQQRASWAGSWMLRANRMTPQGGCARNSAASSADSPGRRCRRWRLSRRFPCHGRQDRPPPIMTRMLSEVGDRAAGPFGAHALAERRGLGTHRLKPPVRTRQSVRPSCSVLLIAGWRLSSRSGMRFCKRCHSVFAAASDETAASCTSAALPAGAVCSGRRGCRMLVRRGRAPAFCACACFRTTGLGAVGAAAGTGAVGETTGAGAGGGGARRACGAGASGGGASLPLAVSPTAGHDVLVRAGDLHAAGIVGLHPDRPVVGLHHRHRAAAMADHRQPPTITSRTPPRPPAISARRGSPDPCRANAGECDRSGLGILRSSDTGAYSFAGAVRGL